MSRGAAAPVLLRAAGAVFLFAVFAALSFLIAAGAASVALAHESPHGLSLLWSLPARDAMPVVLTNRGLVFEAQPGAEPGYGLRCNEAYGVNTAAQPRAFFDDAGRLGLVTYQGVRLSADRGCSWAEGSGLPAVSLGGFSENLQRPGEYLVSTQSYQVQSQIFVSQDYGHSWSLRATNQAATAYQTLLGAPDGRTVFASGNRFDAASKKLIPLWARSRDGGETWEEQELSAARHPLGVHPTRAEVVFARAPDPLASLAPAEELLRSEDGGKTFTRLLSMPPISAFAATPDGSTMWVGSSTGGLLRSQDGGKSFAPLQPEQILGVFCLQHRQDRLWLCARWAPNKGGVWSSDDGGESWSPRLSFDQVTENVACASEQAAVCAQPWRDWEYELLALSPSDAGVVADAAGSADAGEAVEPAAAGEGDADEDAGAASEADPPHDAAQAPAAARAGDCSVGAGRAPGRAWLVAIVFCVSGLCLRRDHSKPRRACTTCAS